MEPKTLTRVALVGALLLVAGAAAAPAATAGPLPDFEPSLPRHVCVSLDDGDEDETPDSTYCVGAYPTA